MTTYTIVANDKDPLGANELNAGTAIEPAEGDIFIVDPTVNDNITFEHISGVTPSAFEIQINENPTDSFTIKVDDGLQADISVADNVNATGVSLDAKAASSLDFDAGDGVTFGEFDGSLTGPNTAFVGDNFTATANWKFGDADDVLGVGNNANFLDIDGKEGDDIFDFGRDATINHLDGKAGDDTFTFKSGLTAASVKGADDNDTFNIGANSTIGNLDGGNDNDTYNTKSPSQSSSDMETTNIVCFASGTLIETLHGPVAVERLQAGQHISTLDRGAQRLRWIGSTPFGVAHQLANPNLRPIRIKAGALGDGVPQQDLFVSQNHRILIRSVIVERMFGVPEVFLAAKKLTTVDGVDCVIRPAGIQYFHMLLDHHEAVVSNGAVTESLFLGEQAMIMMGAAARAQVALLSQDGEAPAHHCVARPSPKEGKRIAQLIERHQRNHKPLFYGALPQVHLRERRFVVV